MDAILVGERDPYKLAGLRDWRIKASEETIVKSLVGDYREEHLYVIRQSLECYRKYQKMIRELDLEVKQRMGRLPAKVILPRNPWARSAIREKRHAAPNHSIYVWRCTVRSGWIGHRFPALTHAPPRCY